MNDNSVKCLNPWDCQSKRQYEIDGVYCALNAGNSAGGQAHGVCYTKEQADKIYRMKCNFSDKNTDTPDSMDVREIAHELQSAVYDARGNGSGFIAPTLTGDHENRITDYTSVVIIDHSRRHSYQPLDVVPTMEAHMGTGGGNVPIVLMDVR